MNISTSTSISTSAPLKVFVTGGSGKLGSAVITELIAAGHTVVNLDQAPLGSRCASSCGSISATSGSVSMP